MATPEQTVDPAVLAATADEPWHATAGSTRNINIDVHQGYQAQRPFARVEDLMANNGWTSFADLPKEAGVKQDRDGTWFREINANTGRTRTVNGVLQHEMHKLRRPVALSLEDAKGSRADYFDGSSWIRNGLKREIDLPENQGNVVAPTDVEWVDAGPEDQAVFRTDAAKLAGAMGMTAAAPAAAAPAAPTVEAPRSAAKGRDNG